jgi:hypothetical protein
MYDIFHHSSLDGYGGSGMNLNRIDFCITVKLLRVQAYLQLALMPFSLGIATVVFLDKEPPISTTTVFYLLGKHRAFCQFALRNMVMFDMLHGLL